MENLKFTLEDKNSYDSDGFVVKRNFFSKEEIDLLYETALNDQVINKNSYDLNDKQGFKTKLALWYTPGDDIYGNYSRCEKMYNSVEMLLGGTPAHFHSKLMQKEPKIGGAWEWHQDYGYWYKNGFLFPDMLSVMVALTQATKENGCLQVIKGSHKMNRIEHGFSGEQVGADQERVDAALRDMDLIYVELNPGDTLFFHCNLLHRSEMNTSDHSRWSLISAYNLVTNKPYKEGENPSSYTPLIKVSDDAIIKSGSKGISNQADFLSKEIDKSLK